MAPRVRMPYSLTIKAPERQRQSDEKDGDLTERRRRFSLSTPSELARPSVRVPRGASFSDDATLTGQGGSPKLVLTPSLSTSRVERLLRERQLRRSGSCFQFGDPGPEFAENATPEQIRPDSRNSSHNNVSALEHSPQRLLVVANRLPVSAIAKADGSWSLELSAGGLVSALLGEDCKMITMSRVL